MLQRRRLQIRVHGIKATTMVVITKAIMVVNIVPMEQVLADITLAMDMRRVETPVEVTGTQGVIVVAA